MSAAPLPLDEEDRLAALRALGLLDTEPEERFDRITRTAARLLDTPIATVTLVDANRQWFKSCIGLDKNEDDRGVSFCAHAILQDEPLVIEDACADPRFAANPLVTGEPEIRAYAGRPLRAPGGQRVGTLCVIDQRPRRFTDEQVAALEDLAQMAEAELGAEETRRRLGNVGASEARLRAIVDAAAEGVAYLGPEGRVGFLNESGTEILGCRAEAVTGRSFEDVVRPDGTDSAVWRRASGGGGESVPSTDAVWTRGDGTSFPVRYAAEPVVDGGRLVGAVVTFTDMTATQAAEELKNRFVASVSHELRSPLTSIRGYLEVLIEEEAGPLNEEQQEAAGIALANAMRLTDLIGDLLLVSRLDAGGFSLDVRPVDLRERVLTAATNAAPAAREGGVDLSVEALEAPAAVVADPLRTDQIIANLLSNAIKFTPSGGSVRVALREAEDGVELAVVDTGVGIPADELVRLGNRFYRASTAATREGTGLGLAIVRELLERHGGRLEIESEVGRGSTFRAWRPREAAAEG